MMYKGVLVSLKLKQAETSRKKATQASKGAEFWQQIISFGWCQPCRIGDVFKWTRLSHAQVFFHPETHHKSHNLLSFSYCSHSIVEYYWVCVWVCASILRCRAAELWGYESLWSGSMAPLVTHPTTPSLRCQRSNSADGQNHSNQPHRAE